MTFFYLLLMEMIGVQIFNFTIGFDKRMGFSLYCNLNENQQSPVFHSDILYSIQQLLLLFIYTTYMINVRNDY